MRPIQLHPLSILVGLGIATLAFVAMGQTPQVLGRHAGAIQHGHTDSEMDQTLRIL